MTVEQYRERIMDTFHNADCDELIALVVFPTEKGFEHLKWLLKTHYKKEVNNEELDKKVCSFQQILIDSESRDIQEISRDYVKLQEKYIKLKKAWELVKEEIINERRRAIRNKYSQRQSDYCNGFDYALGFVFGVIDKHLQEVENADSN